MFLEAWARFCLIRFQEALLPFQLAVRSGALHGVAAACPQVTEHRSQSIKSFQCGTPLEILGNCRCCLLDPVLILISLVWFFYRCGVIDLLNFLMNS